AINPLLKVMNLVSLLIAPAIVTYSIGSEANTPLRLGIAGLATAIIVGAVVFSKRKPMAMETAPETEKINA
ncbi:MAG: hypothetical protein ACRDT6_29175, partial [Micromonosporaceae bacterium]